jgi:hypothetical protein
VKVLIDQGTPASVNVRAADAVLNHSSKAIEMEDIQARISQNWSAAPRSQASDGNMPHLSRPLRRSECV